MLCRVEMPTHEAIFCRFYRYNMKRSGLQNSVLVLSAMALVLAAVLWQGGANSLLALLPIAVAALYAGYSLYLQPILRYRKKEGVALQTEVYVFTPSGFTRSVRSEEEGQLDHVSMQYNTLVKAVETAKDFYLYISPKQAYFVDEEYFTDGSAEELRKLLGQAMQDKFITRQK